MRRFCSDFLQRNALLFLVAALALSCANNPFTRRAANVAASPSPVTTGQTAQQQSDTINRPTSKPYTGELSIFEDPKRDERLQPNRVMDLLKIKEGSSVADIGAGSGWFTVRAARRIGNNGVVYAVDINRDYLDYIEKRAKHESLANIRTIVGKEDDPLLPANSVDAVLLLKTYHEVAQPIRLLKRTREAMRTGALLGIIDRNGKGDDHGIDKEIVIDEAGRAGFVLVNQYDFVKPDNVDYFLVFRAK
jgi:predicted methyltransferase